MKTVIIYKVYELSKQHANNGILIGTYKTKTIAERVVNESIYRFMKETTCIIEGE